VTNHKEVSADKATGGNKAATAHEAAQTHEHLSTVLSRAPLGLAAPQVRVEVHLGTGLPAFALVGLPEAVVRESKERVRSALMTGGFDFPSGRITVNLSPADLPKEGGRFDLPIAIGILAASRKIPARAFERREFYGELSLGGELRQLPKLLPALIEGSRLGRELILPSANALEAGLVPHAKLKLVTCVRCSTRSAAKRHGLPVRTPRTLRTRRSRGTRRQTPILPRFAANSRPSAPSRSPPPESMDC
jgi:magnesium chelatase family protein